MWWMYKNAATSGRIGYVESVVAYLIYTLSFFPQNWFDNETSGKGKITKSLPHLSLRPSLDIWRSLLSYLNYTTKTVKYCFISGSNFLVSWPSYLTLLPKNRYFRNKTYENSGIRINPLLECDQLFGCFRHVTRF